MLSPLVPGRDDKIPEPAVGRRPDTFEVVLSRAAEDEGRAEFGSGAVLAKRS